MGTAMFHGVPPPPRHGSAMLLVRTFPFDSLYHSRKVDTATMFRTISSRWYRWKQFQCSQNSSSLLFISRFSAATKNSNDNVTNDKSIALPPPIRVSLTESTGRGTFATRKIVSGDLIHTAKPLISHPSFSLLQNVCYFCLKRLGAKASPISLPSQDRCGADSSSTELSSDAVNQRVYFCSEECRENSKVFYEVEKIANWSAFDDHCRLQGLKYPFLVKRLACMIISGAASADCLDILQPATLFPEMILEMEKEFQLLRHTLMKAGLNEQIAFLTKQWYIGVLARIRINAFRVEPIGGSYEDLLSAAAASVAAEAAVGNAVYMLPSFYNHDCDPNTHIIWIENADARIKAIRGIEADEELRICYIDASIDHGARQTLLSEGFGFQCRCLRCISGD